MGVLPWTLLLNSVIICFKIQFVISTCIKGGNIHQNGSVWMEDRCRECRCESPLVVCEPTVCLHTGCHTDQNEVWVSGRTCCPTCSTRKRPCLQGNETHMDLSTWKQGPCTSCSCSDGHMTCSDVKCADDLCKPGQVPEITQEQCCPQCQSVKRGCNFDGLEYADGIKWQPFACVLCTCSNGIVTCFTKRCPVSTCPVGNRLLTLPGDCCPQCLAPPCEDFGILHQLGSEWMRDRCTWCKCEAEGVICYRQNCAPCPQDKNTLWKRDRCCPLCVAKGRSCVSKASTYHHTETWHISQCELCVCNNGNVLCSKTECSRLICSENEILHRDDGNCCPTCVPRDVCDDNGATREHGDSWQPSECEWCLCRGGVIQCYELTCSNCPSGLLRRSVLGQCCGQCVPNSCSPECSECLHGDPSICTTCRDPRLYLQEGRCLQQCGSAFYLSPNRSCAACHSECLTCSGPTNFHCLTCPAGTVWEDGACLKNCSASHLLHKDICQGCPPGCLRCNSTEVCDVCTDSHVVHNGHCRPRCPRRGLWLLKSQTCKENRQGPVLKVHGQVSGQAEEDYIVLTTDTVNVVDSDSPLGSLSLRLTRPPFNGQLVYVKNGQSTVIHRGARFDYQYLQAGRLLFQHDKNKPLKGFFSLLAEDGLHRSQAMTITIQLMTHQPPVVRKKETMILRSGEKSALSAREHLQVEDQDSPGAVTFSLIQGPYHGSIVRNDESGSVSAFSLQDLEDGRIIYVHHDNTTSSEDHIVLQASDGTHTIITLLNILITPEDRKEPVVVRNQPLYVDDQGETLISSDILFAVQSEADPTDIVYSLLTPPTGLQQNGSILMVVSMTSEEPPEGWNIHSKGKMSAIMTRFRQSDVIQQRLWYKHEQSGTTSDRLFLKVCDVRGRPQCAEDFSLNVEVIPPQNDAISNQPGFMPSLVFLPNENNNRLGTIAFDNEVKVLKATDLGMYIPDTEPGDVVYRVTSALSAGEGTIEHVNQPRVPLHLFTLEDLASDLILYRPPTGGIGQDEREVVFKFVVEDSGTGSELPEQSFHITVIPVKTSPPVASNSNPRLRVAQASSVSIGPGVVHITDPDTPSADLVITVEKIPRAGVFMKMDDENKVVLQAGNQFDFGELESGHLFYMHDGSNTLSDSFYISVTDGQHSVGIHIELDVTRVDRSAPTPDPEAAMGITLPEGTTEQITRRNMAFRDIDSEDDELVIVMVTEARGGGFIMAGTSAGTGMIVTGKSFTQRDINDGYVSFKAQSEIGPRPRTENVYVNVTDSNGNILVAQQFTITTTPINNQVPVVTLTESLQVEEGGRIPLTLTDISVTDADTLPEDLHITIDTPPKHGTFENVRPEEGSEVLQSVKVLQFNMLEVINGHIHYVQTDHLHHEPLLDQLTLHVDDGHNSSPTFTLLINIQPRNDEIPSIRVEVATCEEGRSLDITNETLSVSDVDTPPQNIIFTLENIPKQGSLRMKAATNEIPFSARKLYAGDTFTFSDILGGLMVYTPSSSSEDVVTDQISLSATDGEFTDSANYVIKITPRDDETPRVVINRGLRVPPGSGTVLSSFDLQASDLDSDDSLLMYTLTHGPTLGTWLLTLPAEGPTGPDHFLLQDDPAKSEQTNENLETKSNERHRRQSENSYPSEWVEMPSSHSRKGTRLTGHISRGDVKGFQRVRAELLWEDSDTLHLEGAPVNTFVDRADVPGHSRHESQHREGYYQGREGVLAANQATPVYTTHNPLKIGEVHPSDLPTRGFIGNNGNVRPTNGQLPPPGIGEGGEGQGGPGKVTTIAVSADGLVHGFRQKDINEGRVQFVHSPGEPSGVSRTMFSVSDPEGNVLLDQTFIVNIVDDRIPPKLINNQELVVQEGSEVHITTDVLSATDGQIEHESIRFAILQPPNQGHLAMTTQRDVPIAEFLQSDLAANRVIYVHTSNQEASTDQFTFSVSDGPNQVVRQFYVKINPVDNKLPTVFNRGLSVNVGEDAVITAFDLDITDPDTKENSLRVEVTRGPEHGELVIHQRGDQPSGSIFTMEDIHEGRVSYVHDGSTTTEDSFHFIVTDGSNSKFIVQGVGETDDAQTFHINILQLNGHPRLLVNNGLRFLTYDEHLATGTISSKELYAEDGDTLVDHITYIIRVQPSHGYISFINRTTPLQEFTQGDISNGFIRYVLSGNVSALQDQFTFDVLDSTKAVPNTLSGSVFHIQWTLIKFQHGFYNTSETSGMVYIPVKRIGAIKLYSVVRCQTIPDTATSEKGNSRAGRTDFISVSGQIQFEGFEEVKMCKVAINDDSVFEGPETFYLQLSHPEFSLLGQPSRTAVTIYDREDEPEIQFEFGELTVNENIGVVRVPLIRTGDIGVMATVTCYTQRGTAQGSSVEMLDSGSDYQTRPHHHSSRVMFGVGAIQAFCDVRIIDDSLYEEEERFELVLSEPSMMTKLGERKKTTVTITGPNDIPSVHLSEPVYYVDEAEGEAVVTVVRSGPDLSPVIDLWCGARPSTPISALPGEDFLPSPQQITLQPGQKTQACTIAIVDDASDMRLEGNETLEVYLYDVVGAVLDDPPASIIFINDTNEDVAVVQFEKESYIFDENTGIINVPIVRTGDVSYETSVICFTRQRRARVMMDYVERPWTDASRIPFLPGQRAVNCTIELVDDIELEAEEDFVLRLADPIGFEQCGVRIGQTDRTTITIKDHQDVPQIEFEKPTYEVSEPPDEESVTSLEVVVVRHGDQRPVVEVRCSTRDGSAIAGLDYDAHSQVITFLPGVSRVTFEVEILHNPGNEWQEAFTVVLGPAMPSGVVLGELSETTVVILDNEASGSLVFPAPPIVISLLDYDNVESGAKDLLSPGYPVVCVTACDPKHPSYAITGPLCESSGINQTAVVYQWQLSIPSSLPDPLGLHTSFNTIKGHLPFTRCDRKLLENIYFRPGYQIRCTAQPVDESGRKGAPSISDCVTIGSDNGMCRLHGHSQGVHGQTFVGNLEYMKPSSIHHPNTLHVTVKIPHHDGLLPLVSTHPIHNLQYLLTVPSYRQQHACSNFAPLPHRRKPGFMQIVLEPVYGRRGHNLPYQYNEDIRGASTVDFYKHLDLRSCAWTFDAYFDMSELVDLCHAHVLTDFEVVDKGQSRVTVRIPLYVAYVYNAGVGQWSSVNHRTELELSIMYDTMVWRAGLGTGLDIREEDLTGHLQMIKVTTDKRGCLVMEFKTRPNFRGLYLINHPVHPDWTAVILPPNALPITLRLQHMWGQPTFDSPEQHWRATSDLSLQDYSGDYHIQLIPCIVRPLEQYPQNGQVATVCTPYSPKSFDVSLTFQQTLRPLPAVYNLATDFHITSNLNEFLMDPVQTTNLVGFDGVFNRGDKLYGRVLWSPSQDLKNAYQLQIEKVFACTGTDGYVPTYDPTGETYGAGGQYGCLHPSRKLSHRYMVLDRGDPAYATKSIAGHRFDAQFASDNVEYRALWDIPGIDGFTMNIEPLFKVKSGNIWYLQVLYIIRPSQGRRLKRSQPNTHNSPSEDPLDTQANLTHSLTAKSQTHNQQTFKGNGTNILILRLNLNSPEELVDIDNLHNAATSDSGSKTSPPTHTSKTTVTVLSILVVLLCFVFLASCLLYWRRTRKKRTREGGRGSGSKCVDLTVSIANDSAKCDSPTVKTSVIQQDKTGQILPLSPKHRLPRPASV